MSNKISAHIIAYGRVQGVGYRYFVKEKALDLHLNGWVKNCPNRTVEIEVEGDHDSIKTFIDFLKIGNGFSRVEKVSYSQLPGLKNYSSFQIRY